MQYEVDFKQVATTPILDVVKMLGLELREATTSFGDEVVPQFVGSCPISKSGNPTCFKVTPRLNRFVCFCTSCKALPKNGGDCIELVCRVHGVDRMTAAKEIKGAGKRDDNAGQQQEVAARRKPSTFDPLAYLKTLDAEHEALKDLDILPETIILFRGGYSSKGLNRGRLAVAYFNLSGEVEMFIGVALDGSLPRYLAPKGQELPYFFNMHTVEEGAELHILSNVFDVMRAVENGASNVICPLKEVDYLSLSGLAAFVKTKKLTVEF